MFEKLEDIDFLLKRLEEKRDEYTRELISVQDRIDRLSQQRTVVEKEMLVVEYKRVPRRSLRSCDRPRQDRADRRVDGRVAGAQLDSWV